VAFTAYWGFASLLTYPIIAENPFPWEMVHVVAPLAVPAAVALAWIARESAAGVARDDAVRAGAAALLVVLLVGQMGVTAYDTSFQRAQSPDVEIVQCAQPPDRMQETLSTVSRLAAENEGTDVLYYGEPGDDTNLFSPVRGEWHGLALPPAGWWDRLPLPWYFSAHDVATDGTTNESRVLAADAPVVVGWDGNADGRGIALADDLQDAGYRRVAHARHACFSGDYVFFIRT
jgi:uncharacterized protein (TIGR03663 family)